VLLEEREVMLTVYVTDWPGRIVNCDGLTVTS
jgi:hypothetical protein